MQFKGEKILYIQNEDMTGHWEINYTCLCTYMSLGKYKLKPQWHTPTRMDAESMEQLQFPCIAVEM